MPWSGAWRKAAAAGRKLMASQVGDGEEGNSLIYGTDSSKVWAAVMECSQEWYNQYLRELGWMEGCP